MQLFNQSGFQSKKAHFWTHWRETPPVQSMWLCFNSFKQSQDPQKDPLWRKTSQMHNVRVLQHYNLSRKNKYNWIKGKQTLKDKICKSVPVQYTHYLKIAVQYTQYLKIANRLKNNVMTYVLRTAHPRIAHHVGNPEREASVRFIEGWRPRNDPQNMLFCSSEP